MAGSRLDKIGTIFSRTTGLLQSGAMKYQDRPLWYDIYRVFPPKYEPYIEREPEKSPEDIREIFYEEDVVRAKSTSSRMISPSAAAAAGTFLTNRDKKK